MFIALDGGDGAGKGVQIEFLKRWLAERGLDFVFVRDPGDTSLGDIIRSLLLKNSAIDICPLAEAALFMASRAQLVQEIIEPALEAGKVVLVDRYLLSTVVYQGYANDATEEEIATLWRIGTVFTKGILPDVTFILDCPSEVCNERLSRDRDRIEARGIKFHSKVAQGYRQAAQTWNQYARGEVFVIDATLTPQEVFNKIKAILESRVP